MKSWLNKKAVIDFVKKNRFLYHLYYYTASGILRFLGHLIRAEEQECMFICFGGRSYGDNVRPVYEQMLREQRFAGWKFVWAFREPDQVRLPDEQRTIKCKTDSLSFYYHALRAKCWVTNVSMQRGLNFKNKGTLYVNTWHGVPLKLIGEDLKKGSAFKVKKAEQWDLVLAEGTYDAKISETAFGVSKEQIRVTGYPRNDILFQNQERTIDHVYNTLHLDRRKKVILYAPTYRDYNRDKTGGFTFEMKLSAEKFSKVLGNEYQLLVRAHGAIENNSAGNGVCIDVTAYPRVEDLMLAADILVSDYSGIIFDYSLLEKPVVCFIYDIEKYREYRGFYVDAEEFLPFKKCYTEEELYAAVASLDYGDEKRKSAAFKKKCGLVAQEAAKNAVDAIWESLGRPSLGN